MAKAEINLPNGTKIIVDGTSEEIIKIKESLSNEQLTSKRKNVVARNSKSQRVSKEGPLVRIRALIEKKFFNKKRVLEDVRKKFEEMAIFYKPSDLSTSLIRLVQSGELRRIKEDSQWRYVNS